MDALAGRMARAGALWDAGTLLLLAGLFAAAVFTFDAYAISNDEEVQRHYGKLIIAYYRSGFSDQSLFLYKNLYLYGGLFDVVSGLLEEVLPGIEPYSIRHMLCALTGIGGIAAAGATARLVAGPRAGFIAAAALAVSGVWYGAMFNHTKDIPFAAVMAGGMYFLLRAAAALPRPRRAGMTDVIGFGLMLGMALGIRVLGLLLVVYAALAVVIATAQHGSGPWRSALQLFYRCVVAFAPAIVIGYLIMIAAWPWAALAPLNPIRGLIDFGNFNYQIRTIVAGQIFEMAAIPRWYVPVYLLIKLPMVMLAGAALSLVPLRAAIRREPRSVMTIHLLLLMTAAIFPVLCQVIDRGPAFCGLRHFLFVVPVFAMLAGIGFDRLLSWLASHRPPFAALACAALAAAIGWNAATLVRLHPYQYLFYNPLVGGLEGASEGYVTDYWVNIMPEAVDQLESYVAQLDRDGGHPQRYLVAVCGERVPFEKEAGLRLQWTADWQRAEFFIAPTHMNCDRALAGRTVATIRRLGARIGVVKDRRELAAKAMAGEN